MAFPENRLTIITMRTKRAPLYRLNEKRRALFYCAVYLTCVRVRKAKTGDAPVCRCTSKTRPATTERLYGGGGEILRRRPTAAQDDTGKVGEATASKAKR